MWQTKVNSGRNIRNVVGNDAYSGQHRFAIYVSGVRVPYPPNPASIPSMTLEIKTNPLLVSVIIPTYNRLEFLKEAVSSVREQTYRTWELIVIDDGSTDGTRSWLKDSRIKHVVIPHCGMPGHVRNIGVREARSDYVAFLDSDDLWKEQKLEEQIRFLEMNPSLPLCHTREIWLRGKKTVSQAGQKHSRSGDIFSDSLRKCIIGPSTVLMRKHAFFDAGSFDPDLEIAEDYDLWLRLTARHLVGYLDMPLVVKRAGHPGQLSEKYGQIEVFRIRALRKNIDTGWLMGDKNRMARTELARKCRIYAEGCRKRGRSAEAEEFEGTAVQYDTEPV